MERSEPVGNCGCQLARDKDGLRMIDCALHKSAPDLLEACKAAKEAIVSGQNYHNGDRLPNNAIILLEQAIVAAEGME